jgi:hypothetical protein
MDNEKGTILTTEIYKQSGDSKQYIKEETVIDSGHIHNMQQFQKEIENLLDIRISEIS